MVAAVNDPSVISLDKEGALLGADIAVADFADLALNLNIHARDKGAKPLIKAGTATSMELRGNCDR